MTFDALAIVEAAYRIEQVDIDKPTARSATRPMPLRWWLRPVSRHARVGEHSAVVWKLPRRTPPAARPSITGVSMSLP